MRPATDSATIIRARRIGVTLALLLTLTATGCARLRSFRQGDRPAFGTETASNDDPSGVGASSGDLYASRVGKPQTPSDTALARNDAGRAAAETAPDASQAETPQVALQAPVTLPTLANPNRPAGPKPDQTPVQTAGTDRLKTASAQPPSAGPTLDTVIAESRRAVDGLTAYRVPMNHQERVNGNLNATEDVILNIRRNPKAVRLEWPTGPHKGREVVYAADANGGLMHVHMGNSLVPLPRLSMPPDSPMAMSNSRHPITEAGFDTIVANMESGLRAQPSAIRYQGLETPQGLTKPCHKVVRVTPQNETWLVYIDPDTRLPALVQATAANGDVLERYVFGDPTLNPPDLASADAFDPDARWGASKGLFQRLARSGAGADQETTTR